MVPTWLLLILGSWLSLWIASYLLKTSRSTKRSYNAFISTYGFSISPYKLQWYTTTFNEWFAYVANHKRLQWFLDIWFDIGVFCGLFCMVASSCLLMFVLARPLISTDSVPADNDLLTLTPVLPGVNIPLSDFWYLAFTLLLCAIFHEVGHAVAAAREGMRLNGFGVFLLAVYPGAFVDLNTESVMVASPWKRLRVFCAGVWHNVFIVVVAAGFIFLLPVALAPFYSREAGAVVTWSTSSLEDHATNLMPGDVITAVDNCTVTGVGDWHNCISFDVSRADLGFCIDPSTFAEPYLAGDENCCPENSSSHLCFSFDGKSEGDHKDKLVVRRCLRARTVCSSFTFCRADVDCQTDVLRCAVPYFGLDRSGQQLFKVSRNGGKQPILFVGHPMDLFSSVIVTDYYPRMSIIPLGFPLVFERLLQFMFSMSSALALLNVVPCYALDGQWILLAAAELLLKKHLPTSEARDMACSLCLFVGTLLLFGNVAVAMYNLLF